MKCTPHCVINLNYLTYYNLNFCAKALVRWVMVLQSQF